MGKIKKWVKSAKEWLLSHKAVVLLVLAILGGIVQYTENVVDDGAFERLQSAVEEFYSAVEEEPVEEE